MAERTPYRATGGGSLANLAGFQASNAPAQAFGQLSGVAEQQAHNVMDYDRSLRVRMLNQSVDAGRVTLAEKEAQYKAQPDLALAETDSYIRGKSQELAKQDSRVAEDFEREMRLQQRLIMVRVNERWDADEAAKLRASAMTTGQNVLAAVNAESLETPEGQEGLALSYRNYIFALNAKSPKGEDVFSPEQRVQAEQAFLQGAGEQIIRTFIRQSNAEDAATIEQQLRDGTMEIPFPFVDKNTANMGELTPERIDQFINMAQERQRELQRGAATYSAAQIIDAENAFTAMKMDLQAQGGASSATMTPEQIAIKFGEGEEGKANYYLTKTQLQAQHDGYVATPAQLQEAMADQPVYVAAMMEGAAQAQKDIAEDGAIYMIQADPAVAEAWENMNREKQPGFTGPPQGAAPYLAALEAGYAARGVPVAQRKVIPKKQAAWMAGQLQAPNPDGSFKSNRQIQAELQGIAQQYGPAAGRVMHEIHKEGLAGKYLVVADLPEGVASKVLDGMDQWPTMESHLKSVDGMSVESLDKLITKTSKYQQFIATLPTGFKQEADRFRTTALTLAMKYFMDGDEPSIQSAYERAIDDTIYSVYQVDGKTRIPKAKYNDAVSRGLSEGSKRKVIDGIKGDIDFSDWTWYGQPIVNAEDKAEAVQRLYESAEFITNSDETGVTLVTQGGNTVKLTTGEWGMTWDELGVWGAGIEAQRKQAAIGSVSRPDFAGMR